MAGMPVIQLIVSRGEPVWDDISGEVIPPINTVKGHIGSGSSIWKNSVITSVIIPQDMLEELPSDMELDEIVQSVFQLGQNYQTRNGGSKVLPMDEWTARYIVRSRYQFSEDVLALVKAAFDLGRDYERSAGF